MPRLAPPVHVLFWLYNPVAFGPRQRLNQAYQEQPPSNTGHMMRVETVQQVLNIVL